MLILLNYGSDKLDHLITTSKPFGNYSGIGYKGESFGSKTVFVKSRLLDDSLNIAVKNPIVKSISTSKTVRNPMKNKKGKIFVHVCHFCGVKGHI